MVVFCVVRGILELVRTVFAACLPAKALATEGGGEEIPPFTRLNFLKENLGGQEFGKAAEPHE